MAGALPGALASLGVEVRTLLPGYPAVLAGLQRGRSGLVPGRRCSAARPGCCPATEAGLDLLVLDAPHLFDRPGNPYVDPTGLDWPDNHRRFGALARVAADIGLGRLGPWRPDIVHAHDWQAGLVPLYLRLADGPRPATVLTVHNLAFQGLFPTVLHRRAGPAAAGVPDRGLRILGPGRLPQGRPVLRRPHHHGEPDLRPRDPDRGRGHGPARPAAGRATPTSSASPTASTPRSGIRPTDRHLPAHLRCRRRSIARPPNKRALQERFRLDEDPDALLFAVISRLTEQKGLDLLLGQLPLAAGRGRPARPAGLGPDLARGRVSRCRGRPSGPGRLLLRL